MDRRLFPLAAPALILSLLAACSSPAPSLPATKALAVVPPVVMAPAPMPAPAPVEAPKAPSALSEFESDIGAAAAEAGVKLIKTADGDQLLLRAGGDAAFAPSGTSLTPRYAAFLKELAKHLAQHQSLNVKVTGHTDATGNDKRNDKLSEARAQAAGRALIQAGLADFRVYATGKGKREPIAGNETAAGRASNRRVDMVVTDNLR